MLKVHVIYLPSAADMREDFPLPTLPTTATRAPSGTRQLMSRRTTGPSPESVPHVNDAWSRVSWSETDSSWPIWGKEDLNIFQGHVLNEFY